MVWKTPARVLQQLESTDRLLSAHPVAALWAVQVSQVDCWADIQATSQDGHQAAHQEDR